MLKYFKNLLKDLDDLEKIILLVTGRQLKLKLKSTNSIFLFKEMTPSINLINLLKLLLIVNPNSLLLNKGLNKKELLLLKK